MNVPSRGVGDKTQELFFTAVVNFLNSTNKRISFIVLLSEFVQAKDYLISKNKDFKYSLSNDSFHQESIFFYDFINYLQQSLSLAQKKSILAACSIFIELYDSALSWQGTTEELLLHLFKTSGIIDINYLDWKKSNFDLKNLLPSDKIKNKVLQQLLFIAANTEVDKSSEDFLHGTVQSLQSILDKFLIEDSETDNDLNEHNNFSDGKVKLMTVHATKGLEFDCVIIPGLEEGSFPMKGTINRVVENTNSSKFYIENREDLHEDEERRLLYVGMTRAKRYLYLTYRSKMIVGRKHIPLKPSLFLSAIQKNLFKFSKYYDQCFKIYQLLKY